MYVMSTAFIIGTNFIENYIDGNEFITLDADDVKALVKAYGFGTKNCTTDTQGNKCESYEVIKIYVYICNCYRKYYQLMSCQDVFSSYHSPHSRPPSSTTSTPSQSDNESFLDVSASPGPSISIPNQWRPHVETCITKKLLDNSARNEIVRALVHVLFTKFKKPTRFNCEEFARKLVLKYPFMKDDLDM